MSKKIYYSLDFFKFVFAIVVVGIHAESFMNQQGEI